MTTMVEELRFGGSLWSIYDDGKAYEAGTGRQYLGGADALRAKILLERMRKVRPIGGSFRPGVVPFWRMSYEDWDLLLRSPDWDRVAVGYTEARVFGIDVRCQQSMERGSVELVVAA